MTCKIDVNGIWAGVAGYREEFTPPPVSVYHINCQQVILPHFSPEYAGD